MPIEIAEIVANFANLHWLTLFTLSEKPPVGRHKSTDSQLQQLQQQHQTAN